MRLVLVHGINNQNQSSERIGADWIQHLERTLGGAGRFGDLEVVAPFYGAELHRLEGVDTPEGLVEQGVTGSDSEAEAFIASATDEIAAHAGITPDALAAEMQATGAARPATMGLSPHDRNFIAFIQLVERLSPLQGRVAMRLLNQAYIYLKRPAVSAAVDAIVMDALAPADPAKRDEPTVVLAHSLGTIVTFKLLRQLAMSGAPRKVPLFCTLGSPLAIKVVQSALNKPRMRPAGVARWLNGRDPDDFVTLGKDLNHDTFGDGVENISDVDNPGDDAHAISGYLADKRIAEAVAKACEV